ncbi:hypothetical protein NLI96_g3794 [Meripilus lineatus]|uniref:Uncharacterized protein n=1 Tax=Meripilus lineatus TaxID=2056292 RepID=A0AAD5VAZ8_9APHY|nr:hypothetical protein NLI96_g3794 [Physisporinus lineatus]
MSLGRGLLSSGPRGATTKILAFGSLFIFLATVYTLFPSTPKKAWATLSSPFSSRVRGQCPPEAYADGKWVHQAPPAPNVTMTSMDDALPIVGFEGCASSREYYWHLASDRPEQWDRFPGVASWRWDPSSECEGLRPLDPEALVQDLVENGGWLLIGDSVTENHFFSLSCILYPHVIATPNYTDLPFYERHWPQNLYLSPSSPLVEYLNPPVGFNISTTPLVTFRRVDVMLSREQLVDLHHDLYDPPLGVNLFSEEAFWSLPPSQYLSIFQKPLPAANYRTMVVSTAGHWTTTLMAGFHDEAAEGGGIRRILGFFRHAMTKWADEIQAAMSRDTGTAGGRRTREVVEVVSSRSYPNIHFLGIDRPGMLRPDAHSTGDCLHIMSGAGVLEGWTHYIWHYITRELPGRIR